MTSVRYRPSNGSEGEGFISLFCCTCARSEHLTAGAAPDDPVGCAILDATFLHAVDDAEYPPEWIRDEGGPRCTAHVPEGEPVPPARCSRTVDMFDGSVGAEVIR